MLRSKPKAFLDIKHGYHRPFSVLNREILLSPKLVKLPLKKLFTTLLLFGVFSYLFFGSVSAPNYQHSLAAQSSEERQTLEKQLAELESQIDEYETTISTYKKQGTTLKQEIVNLNNKVSKINLQIKAINLSLEKLSEEIVQNQGQINITEEKLNLNLEAMRRALQGVYESERISLVAVLLKNPNLSDFFNDINNLLDIQASLNATVDRINALKEELLAEKESLAIKHSDVSASRVYQDSQRRALEDTKRQKDGLLAVTKGQESKYQELLKETQKTAAQIRSRIFEFLGGGEMTFEQAYEFAKIAEKATGVRAAFILAILDRESALGENVGKCKYNEISSLWGKPVMNPTRDTPIFLELTAALGINPETITVSCPNRDGAYGGAMGPAQFIPATWKLFSDKVATITGSTPPSPWRNGDAIVATALYLKDAGASNSERNAAAKYYCGTRWTRYVCTNVYAQKVVEKTRQFQNDIDVLNA